MDKLEPSVDNILLYLLPLWYLGVITLRVGLHHWDVSLLKKSLERGRCSNLDFSSLSSGLSVCTLRESTCWTDSS